MTQDFPTHTYALECVRCGHRSTLSVAFNGSNHNVGMAVFCVACPPVKGERRIGFGIWNRLKQVVAKKKE